MLPLDVSEYERRRRTADSSLDMAALAAEHGLHHHACLHAEQAAQQAIKGLLHAVGSPSAARGHDLAALGDAVEKAVGLWPSEELRPALVRLSRHYLPSRYPDAVPGGTPADHYTREDAETALVDARQVWDATGAAWHALIDAAGTSDAGTEASP